MHHVPIFSFADDFHISTPRAIKAAPMRLAGTAVPVLMSDHSIWAHLTGERVTCLWDTDGPVILRLVGRTSSCQVKLNGRKAEEPSEVAAVPVLVANSPLMASHPRSLCTKPSVSLRFIEVHTTPQRQNLRHPPRCEARRSLHQTSLRLLDG